MKETMKVRMKQMAPERANIIQTKKVSNEQTHKHRHYKNNNYISKMYQGKIFTTRMARKNMYDIIIYLSFHHCNSQSF